MLVFHSWVTFGVKWVENSLLMQSWSHALLSEVFLNSVPLSLRIAILSPLWANMPDRLACTTFSADLSFKGIANTYDVCMHIAVKSHWCPLDVTGRQPIVSIASTLNAVVGIWPYWVDISMDIAPIYMFNNILVKFGPSGESSYCLACMNCALIPFWIIKLM